MFACFGDFVKVCSSRYLVTCFVDLVWLCVIDHVKWYCSYLTPPVEKIGIGWRGNESYVFLASNILKQAFSGRTKR